MAEYIPIEDVIDYTSNSTDITTVKPAFRVSLSHEEMLFTSVGQSKVLAVKNTGWNHLNVRRVVVVGSAFKVNTALPEVLRIDETIFLEIECVAEGFGAVYVDVGDSYGHKLVVLGTDVPEGEE